MSRQKKVLRNGLLIAVVLGILFWGSNLHLSPVKVFEITERQFHYGPSEIVHMEDFRGGKQILAIDNDTSISCFTLERRYVFFWRLASSGGPVAMFEFDPLLPVDHAWSMTGQGDYKFWGIVNDERIERLELEMSDGTRYHQDQFHGGGVFLIQHQGMMESRIFYAFLRGYDHEDQLIYEEALQ